MRRTTHIAVSLVAALAILLGARHAVSRENLAHADLHSWYQQINQQYFGAKLRYVPVEWAALPEGLSGRTDFDDDDTPLGITLDPAGLASEIEAKRTLRHEMCHVSVGPKKGHASAWQACMQRFD